MIIEICTTSLSSIVNAQNALLHRAKLNSLATTGEYSEDME